MLHHKDRYKLLPGINVHVGTDSVSLIDDLEATTSSLARLKKGLEKEFGLKFSAAAFKKLRTVAETVDYVKTAADKRESTVQRK